MTTLTPPQQQKLAALSDEERRNFRSIVEREIERIEQHRRHLHSILPALDAACAEHDMISRGHVGPYEEMFCTRCGAREFIL
jgi:hypothetical protein